MKEVDSGMITSDMFFPDIEYFDFLLHFYY